MEGTTELMTVDNICNRVYIIRGQQVMLDYDLAEIYGYEVKNLNQQVKRNIVRFPEDFMFRLTREEIESVKSQIVISRENNFFEGQGGGRRTLPYAFTEQGIYMFDIVITTFVTEEARCRGCFIYGERAWEKGVSDISSCKRLYQSVSTTLDQI